MIGRHSELCTGCRPIEIGLFGRFAPRVGTGRHRSAVQKEQPGEGGPFASIISIAGSQFLRQHEV